MAKKEGLNKLFGAKKAPEKKVVINENVNEEVMSDKSEKSVDYTQMVDVDIPEYQTPIDDPIVERSYNDIEVDTSIGDVKEPSFVNEKPVFSVEDEYVEPVKEPSAFDKMRNPAMEDLDNKDKKQASEQLVDTVLDAYDMVHQLLQKIATIDESKVQENVINGKIDLSLKVPVSEDTSINALEYVQSHNEAVAENIKYDSDFGEKVRPAMVRVFQKKGWGVTDEQYLLGAFGKDLAVKATLIFTLKKQGNQMIKHFISASQSQGVRPQPEVYEPDTVERPQQQPKKKPEMNVEEIDEVEEVSPEDIENELND
jgi:hypothetical protein